MPAVASLEELKAVDGQLKTIKGENPEVYGPKGMPISWNCSVRTERLDIRTSAK